MNEDILVLVIRCWNLIWSGSADAYYKWIQQRHPNRYHCEDAVIHEMMTVVMNMAEDKNAQGLRRYRDYLANCARDLDHCLDKWTND